MRRTRPPHPGVALAARALLLLSLGLDRAAAAPVVVQVDGAANAGYSNSGAEGTRTVVDVRPSLNLQLVSPRAIWSLGYVFSGSVDYARPAAGGAGEYAPGEWSTTYSNAVDVSLGAQLSHRSSLVLGAGVAQGHTRFQLTQRPPDAGVPEFRRRADVDLVTGTAAESYLLEVSPRLHARQSLAGSFVAPRNALGQYNASVTGNLAFDRLRQTGDGRAANDSYGAELRSSAAWLRDPGASEASLTLTNALLARWSHDFDWRWNAEVAVGVEQVVTLAGSYPLAVFPTGEVTLRYTARDAGGSLTVTNAALTDLQTGTVTMAQSASVRGFANFGGLHPSQLAVSAGVLHAEPIGQSSLRAAAGTGNAVQGDAGFRWSLSDAMLATVRYTVVYQFRQPSQLEPFLVQVLVAGITVHYGSGRSVPTPSLGGRVDGADRAGLPETGQGKR